MSLRTATRLSLRTLRASECGCRGLATVSRVNLTRTAVAPKPTVSRVASLAPRAFSTSSIALKEKRDAWAQNPIIGYEEVKAISEQPNDNILLIDCRETDEVALGTIPSSVNLPLSRIEQALSVDFNPGTFQKEFAFNKPEYKQNMVFFCRSGKRSATACEIANKQGYPNTRNYLGSWLEWCEKEGIENQDDE